MRYVLGMDEANTTTPANKVTNFDLSIAQASMMFDFLFHFRGANRYAAARRMGPFMSFAQR